MLAEILNFSVWTGTLGIFAIGTGLIEAGEKLGNLAPSAILGVVVVCAFCMMKKLYDDKGKTDTKLHEVIANHTRTQVECTEVLREQTKALKEVRINSELCRELAMARDTQRRKEAEANRVGSDNFKPVTFGS